MPDGDLKILVKEALSEVQGRGLRLPGLAFLHTGTVARLLHRMDEIRAHVRTDFGIGKPTDDTRSVPLGGGGEAGALIEKFQRELLRELEIDSLSDPESSTTPSAQADPSLGALAEGDIGGNADGIPFDIGEEIRRALQTEVRQLKRR
jgi:hypothetical protein